jgi:Flp pilus assembly protein TadD
MAVGLPSYEPNARPPEVVDQREDDMKNNGQLTAVLLLAAFGAVGCSNPFEEPETKAHQQAPVSQAKPIAAPNVVDRDDEEGTGGDLPIKSAGPVSFADADAAYQAKNYKEAVTLFQAYTDQRPRNPWGYFMLGLSASKAGDPATAESAFTQALSMDPNHVKSLVNLSRLLIDQGRSDDAVVHLTHAGEIVPESGEVQRLLGRAFVEQHNRNEAESAYRRAIALDPHDAWSMNNLGLLILEQQRAEEALPLLARAVQLRMDVPAFHNNLGMALEHTGRFLAAAEEYRGALTADPGYGKAKQNLARVEAIKVGHEEPFDLEEAVATVGR